MIAAERERQITAEGYTAAHDDEHADGELVKAALCYLSHVDGSSMAGIGWPWDDGWNPSDDDTRTLAKVGAMVAAEIDRRNRGQNAIGDSTLPVNGQPESKNEQERG